MGQQLWAPAFCQDAPSFNDRPQTRKIHGACENGGIVIITKLRPLKWLSPEQTAATVAVTMTGRAIDPGRRWDEEMRLNHQGTRAHPVYTNTELSLPIHCPSSLIEHPFWEDKNCVLSRRT